MKQSTAVLSSILTLLVGYILGSSMGLSDLEGRFGSDRVTVETSELETFVSCEEKFATLISEFETVASACSPDMSEDGSSRVSATCEEDLAAIKAKFESLKAFCSSFITLTESKFEAEPLDVNVESKYDSTSGSEAAPTKYDAK